MGKGEGEGEGKEVLLPPSGPKPVFNLPCVVCGSTQPQRDAVVVNSHHIVAQPVWKRHKAKCIAEMGGNQKQKC